LVNIDELESALFWAERRVLEIQTKLHRCEPSPATGSTESRMR
jgi:hypothetical protein